MHKFKGIEEFEKPARVLIDDCCRSAWLLYAEIHKDLGTDFFSDEDADVFYALGKHPAIQGVLDAATKGQTPGQG